MKLCKRVGYEWKNPLNLGADSGKRANSGFFLSLTWWDRPFSLGGGMCSPSALVVVIITIQKLVFFIEHPHATFCMLSRYFSSGSEWQTDRITIGKSHNASKTNQKFSYIKWGLTMAGIRSVQIKALTHRYVCLYYIYICFLYVVENFYLIDGWMDT